jgi:DNA-binding LacI/PurR family transcriptional regulator
MNEYSIKEISEMAEVSTATISRYLNKNGYVNEKTRNKIEAVLKETGYNPDLRKRRQSHQINSKPKHEVSMIWYSDEEKIQSNTGQMMLAGASEVFFKYNVDFSADYVSSSETLPLSLKNSALDGVLFHGVKPSSKVFNVLKKIPTINLLESGGLSFGGRIMPDHAWAGKIALEYFKANGAKSVCCIKGSGDWLYSNTRCEGFVRSAEAHGLNCKVYEVEWCGADMNSADTIEATQKVVDKLMALKPFPEGVFVSNALSGFVHNLIQKAGKTPMEDFLMVASDEGECPPYLFPAPAKLNIFPKKLGALAAEILMVKISNREVPDFTGMVKPKLIIP